jgi:hypothetical protein
LEFYVDMSGVCATIEDGEGELLVRLVKFVSRVGYEENSTRVMTGYFEAHLRVVAIWMRIRSETDLKRYS